MPRLSTKTSVDVSSLKYQSSIHGKYIDFPSFTYGAAFKPNKQFFVEALAQGTTVGIHRYQEYPTFFKLFQRYVKNRKLKLKLYIRQVETDLWLLIPRDLSEPKPDSTIGGDWREHGRYKWYASELEKGEILKFNSEAEALKARRAWMLYFPPEERVSREAVIELREKTYRVSVRKF